MAPALWPLGESEMARHIRGHDWAATPLGRLSDWSERLKLAVELVLASPTVASLAVGPERRVLYNDSAMRLIGSRHPGVLGLPLAEAFPESYPSVAPLYDHAFSGRVAEVAAQPAAVSEAGGEVFEAILLPVQDESGTVMAVQMQGREVSALLRAKAALRDTEERLTMAAAAAGFVPYEVDLETNTPVWSDEVLAVAGLDRSEVPLSWEGWARLVSAADLRRMREAQARAFDPKGDGALSLEVEVHGARGPRWVQFLGRVHFRGEGAERRPARSIGVLIDQTQAQRTRAALVQAQRLETVGRLAGTVAHDFNNLLSVVLANLDLAQMRTDDRELTELLHRACEAIEMGTGLNRRLVGLVGGRQVRPEPILPVARLAETHALLERILGEGVIVRLEAPPETWPVLIDPGELDGAILNLAVNARDAMPRGGAIVIATANRALGAEEALSLPGARLGEFVRISVADTGSGMSPEVEAQALEPFFTTKAPGLGTGLGLTSVASVAARAGGFVEIDSTPGVGTTVALWLPRHLGPASDPPSQFASDELPLGDGELVLVVEDDALVREATLRRLEVLGYMVLEAGDAAQALRLLEAGEPVDLVLSDVVMPGSMSGVDLVADVRRRWPRVALLLASGYASHALGASAGAPTVELLHKPYSIQALAHAIRRRLEERRDPEPALS